MRGFAATAIALTLAAPLAGSAADPFVLVGGPGNQTAPAMAAPFLAFLDDAGGASDLYLKNLDSGALTRLTTGGPVVGAPDLAGNWVAWRQQGFVEVYDAARSAALAPIAAPGSGRVSLSPALVAWEEDGLGGDVAWLTLSSGQLARRTVAGRQHAIATAFRWVAYIDDTGTGTVHLVDTRAATDVIVFTGGPDPVGTPLDVALWAAGADVAPTVAVTVTGPGGAELAVVDSTGANLARLTEPGEKRNAHLVGDWVGFEDLSTGISQVVLWNWAAPTLTLEYPGPATTDQVLHDLANAESGLKVVWASENAPDGLDVFEWDRTGTVPPPPPPGPVTCADASATVLADFTVLAGSKPDDGDHDEGHHDDGDHDDGDHDDGRHDDGDHDANEDVDHGNDGWHLSDTAAHDERWHSYRRAVGGARFDAPVATRVLVCISATDVASGWVGAGSRIVAAPSDFRMGPLELEARVTVAAGDGRAGALILGKPGSSLRVRVLADPGGSDGGSTCSATGDCPSPPRGLGHGCATGGGSATLASLVLLAFVVTGPFRRRTRR